MGPMGPARVAGLVVASLLAVCAGATAGEASFRGAQGGWQATSDRARLLQTGADSKAPAPFWGHTGGEVGEAGRNGDFESVALRGAAVGGEGGVEGRALGESGADDGVLGGGDAALGKEDEGVTYDSLVLVYLVSGSLSVMGTVVLAYVYLQIPRSKLSHPDRLIFIVTACDFALTLKFWVGAFLWELGFDDARASFHVLHDDCLVSSLYGQLFTMASISWNAMWCLNFVAMLRNPLRNTASRMRWYHTFVWSMCLIAVIVQWGGAGPVPADHTCWVKSSATNNWVIDIPLYCYIALALYSIAFAAWRLSSGSRETSHTRRALFCRHSMYVVVFFLVWVWPILHQLIKKQTNRKGDDFLDAVDAATVTGQAFIFALIRLNEPGARRIIRGLAARKLSRHPQTRSSAFSVSGHESTSIRSPRSSRAASLRTPLLGFGPMVPSSREDSQRSLLSDSPRGQAVRPQTAVHLSGARAAALGLMGAPSGIRRTGSHGALSSRPPPRPQLERAVTEAPPAGFMRKRGGSDELPADLAAEEPHAGWDVAIDLRMEVGMCMLHGLAQCLLDPDLFRKKTSGPAPRRGSSMRKSGSDSDFGRRRRRLGSGDSSGSAGSAGSGGSRPSHGAGDLVTSSATFKGSGSKSRFPPASPASRRRRRAPLRDVAPPPGEVEVTRTLRAVHLVEGEEVIGGVLRPVLSLAVSKADEGADRVDVKRGAAGDLGGGSFVFSAIHTQLFKQLRDAAGLEPRVVAGSLSPDALARDELSAHFSEGGASSSFFCRSNDKTLIVKTIDEGEVNSLVKFLPAYVQHLRDNPDSLLLKFYGLFSVKAQRADKVYFVLMNNVLPDTLPMTEMYDLKGSTVGREAGKGGKHVSTAGRVAVLKDVDFRERYTKGGVRVGAERRADLLLQLRADVRLLASQKLMDYSLLIGVRRPEDRHDWVAAEAILEQGFAPVNAAYESAANFISTAGEWHIESKAYPDGVQLSPLIQSEMEPAAAIPALDLAGSSDAGSGDGRDAESKRRGSGSGSYGSFDSDPVDARARAGSADMSRPVRPQRAKTTGYLRSSQSGKEGLLGPADRGSGSIRATETSLRAIPMWSRLSVGPLYRETPSDVEEPSVSGRRGSVDDPMIVEGLVQVGVIDILQTYSLEKRVEHTLKSLRHANMNVDISAVEPDTYAARFNELVDKVVFRA